MIPLPPLSVAQQRAVTKLSIQRRGIAWHLPGEGKTRIALSTFATLQDEMEWTPPCVCVVVCRRKAFHTWADEVEACEFPWVIDSFEKGEAGYVHDDAPTIWLVSESQIATLQDRILASPYVRMVILDELYLFKSPSAIKNRTARRLAARYPTIGLSGSMMTAGKLDDVYGQSQAVGLDKLISPNYTKFRSDYLMTFNEGGFPTSCARKGAYERIMKCIEPWTDIHFPTTSERAIHESIIRVLPTKQQKGLVEELRESFEAEKFGYESDSALAVGVKLQQISNGWFKSSDGTISEFPSPKIERLRELVAELLEAGQRCVVWCAFQHDVKMLARILPFATLQMSGVSPLDVDALRSGKYPVVLATEGSGSSINDFANIPYAIYFSQTVKWFDLQQSQLRHSRKSSLHKEVYCYFLHTIGTFDAHIFDLVKRSKGAEGSLINHGVLAQFFEEQQTNGR